MTATSPNADSIVELIADIFERRGAESYIGEAVTMSAHMLQAAQLAEDQRAGDDMIAAALLHDIGHYTSEFGADAYLEDVDNVHEEAGARILEQHFPAVVTSCVRLHVAAKRYLCTTNPNYYAQLSDASVTSLNLQGGLMSTSEVEAFESEAHYQAALRVRVWDDKAKDPDATTPGFNHYAPVLKRVVNAHNAEVNSL
ncbi:MAG: HD domain-containing protein [Pseudomonadota bacterium]